jgi:L-lysine exporter family protein LysE/ArgO
VAFLIGYGVLAARRAWKPADAGLNVTETDEVGTAPERSAAGAGTATLTRTRTQRLLPVVLTALALTWLNPHVYLDTVILLGSVANTHGSEGRWAFAMGACLGSIAWFVALGYGARLLSRWLSSPRAWRILDGVIAAIMLTLAASLALSA